MENMKTYCYILHIFSAHPCESHQKKSLSSHNLNFNIWIFFTSFGRKECNLTIKKLKHVQKAYNCIILQRDCAPPLSGLNQFQFRKLSWSEIARFEIGGAIYILIIATSFFFFIYFYSIRHLLHKHILSPLNYWYYI